MTKRRVLPLLICLCGALFSVSPAHAQRSGFIIDLGVGPGFVSSNTTMVGVDGSTRETKMGLALKFNIGGVVGDALEVYLASQTVVHGTQRQMADQAWTGISGLGVTYPVNPGFSLRGVVGTGQEILFTNGIHFDTSRGLGLLAGGRFALSGRWALDVDALHASWDAGEIFGSEEVTAWSAAVTFSWLSN